MAEQQDFSEGFLLVDFKAEWCEPCKWVEPILDEIIRHFNGRLSLQKVDIDKRPELAKEFHVLSVPTLVLMVENREVWRMRGFDSAGEMIRTISQYLPQ